MKEWVDMRADLYARQKLSAWIQRYPLSEITAKLSNIPPPPPPPSEIAEHDIPYTIPPTTVMSTYKAAFAICLDCVNGRCKRYCLNDNIYGATNLYDDMDGPSG